MSSWLLLLSHENRKTSSLFEEGSFRRDGGALHRYGIRCVVYTTVVWDELAAFDHPEWRQVDREGKLIGRGPLEKWGWQVMLECRGIHRLCVRSKSGGSTLYKVRVYVHAYFFNIRKGVLP